MKTFTLEQIAQITGGMLTKVKDAAITRIAPPMLADENTLALALGEDEIAHLADTKAKAALVPLGVNIDGFTTIEVERPRLAMMKLISMFYEAPHVNSGIHPTAIVPASVKLGENVSLGPNVVLGENVQIGDNTKVLNERKEEILTDYQNVEPIQLQNISSDLMYEKSVLKYEQDGKFGLIDFEGKEITKPIYESIDGLPYKEGELLVKQDGKYGVINIKGNKLVDIKYDKITVDGYYTSENNYKFAGYIISNTTDEGYRYGYINYNGKLLLDSEYNELSRVIGIEDDKNAYILCAKNGQYGITKNDEKLIPNEYQSIEYDESNKLFTIEKSKKFGIANLDGNIIVPTEYNQIDITGIYLYAQNSQGITVYNSDGTQVNIDRNIAILNTSNEKYKIRIDNSNGTKYGVINDESEQVIEEKYNYIEYLFDNYFIASNEQSKLGVIDDDDNVKIELNNDALQKIEGTNVIQATTTADSTTRLYSKEMTQVCEMTNANVEVKENYIKISNELDTKYFDKDGKELNNTEVYPNNTLFKIRWKMGSCKFSR